MTPEPAPERKTKILKAWEGVRDEVKARALAGAGETFMFVISRPIASFYRPDDDSPFECAIAHVRAIDHHTGTVRFTCEGIELP